ncbi:MAG TPA: fused MFS/spermidine synthase [Vicinamibacteria bacterium]|jgi:spermidine synthase|nr:fused MFS/spermidine synthase [Vicinamibacteria bacterium]
MRSSLVHSILYVAFFVSGASALVYQVVWSKYLTLFVGGTSFAHTIVLATFMGGLAFGNWAFGRLSDRAGMDKLLLYALLETGVGLLCLTFPTLFVWLSDIYLAVGSRTGLTSPLNPFLKTGLTVASMFVPCALMGGTLPVLVKYAVESLAGLGARLSWLYFINTAGAVVGCALGGFYVIEHLGLEFGMVGTSLLNIGIGGVCYLLYKQARGPSATAPPAPSPPEAGEVYSGIQARTAFWCIAVAGALSMLYELAWVRILVLSIGGTVHSFSTMLIGFIAGIALGAALAGWLLRKGRNALALFGLCELGIAGAVLIPLSRYQALPYAFYRLSSAVARTPDTYPLYLLLAVVWAGIVMLVPATLMGAALPLATRVCIDQFQTLGRKVGSVFSANTLGNVAGAAVTGFLLLPRLGLERTLIVGSLLSGLLAVIILWAWRPGGRGSPWRALVEAARPGSAPDGPSLWPLVLAGMILLGAFRLWSYPSWDARLMQFGLYRWERKYDFPSWEAFTASRAGARVLYARDGAHASVTVESVSVPAGPPDLVLRINGKPDATSVTDLPSQLLVGHIGMFLHPHPQRVMVVGLGSGATVGAVLRHPGVSVDVAEISPEVVEAAARFERINDGALRNPRFHLFPLDAREFLLLQRNRYDVIVSEPTNVWIPGVASLFTKDFYTVVRARLEPGGLFAQWLQLYSGDPRIVATVVRSLTEVFPFVSAWIVSDADLILLAGRERPPFEPRAFGERVKQVRAGSGFSSPNGMVALLDDPLVILASQLATDQALRLRWPAGSAPALHDLFPSMEFAAARAQFQGVTYAVENDLDERLHRTAHERLFLEEYLSRFPLDEPEEARIITSFSQLSLGYAHLARSLAANAILEGREDPGQVLPLADEVVAKAYLTRALAAELDRPSSAGRGKLCADYLRVATEALRGAASVLVPPPTRDLEARIDACAIEFPGRAEELHLELFEGLAAAGATAPALVRLKTLDTEGVLDRLGGRERARLLLLGAKLEVQAGRLDQARRLAERADRSDRGNPEASRLLSALGSL